MDCNKNPAEICIIYTSIFLSDDDEYIKNNMIATGNILMPTHIQHEFILYVKEMERPKKSRKKTYKIK